MEWWLKRGYEEGAEGALRGRARCHVRSLHTFSSIL
jgi:hypothetical protein